MKVLLVHAGKGSEYREEFYRFEKFINPPLGLCYIGTYLQGAGHEVDGIDLYMIDSNQELYDKFQEKPDVVAIGFPTLMYNEAKRIINKCRELSPKSFIVLGGAHVSFQIENSLDGLKPDAIIPFEGELPMLKLVEALENNRDINSIHGVITKESHQYIRGEYIKDLDTLPIPNLEIFNLDRYFKLQRYKVNGINSFAISGTRGCPANCKFCVASSVKKHIPVRARSTEHILIEIEYFAAKYNTRDFWITDELFVQDQEKILYFCKKLKQLGNFTWSCEGRVDRLTKKTMETMIDAGCVHIQIGIESGDNDTLRNIGKGITTEQIVQVAKWAQEFKISMNGVIIFGLPDDTLEKFQKKYEFTKLLASYGVQVYFTLLVPFPGTEYFERAAEYGISIHTFDWSKYNFVNSIISTKNLSRDEIMAGFVKCLQLKETIYSVNLDKSTEWFNFNYKNNDPDTFLTALEVKKNDISLVQENVLLQLQNSVSKNEEFKTSHNSNRTLKILDDIFINTPDYFPDADWIRFILGNIATILQDYNTSLRYYSDCNPENLISEKNQWVFHYNKGIALNNLENNKKALKAFNKALTLKPDDSKTVKQIANITRTLNNL